LLKIGILGLGTVGSGVVKILEKNAENIKNKVGTEVKIEKILVNNLKKKRDVDIKRELLTNKIDDIINNPEIDIVVELIGGEQPAYDYIIKSIENGKSIVTANKLVIAKYGKKIFKKQMKIMFRFVMKVVWLVDFLLLGRCRIRLLQTGSKKFMVF